MKIIKVYKSLSAFLFYLTLIAIVAGINFSDGRSPGWFVQTLPINDAYNDLFFIDSLHGWMVSTGYSGTSDTGYIIHTSNGGYNWIVQKAEPQLFFKVQFLDTNYGYVVGGSNVANIQKTTNGGLNWLDISTSFYGIGLQDLYFVNKDTGWIVLNGDPFNGGVYRTVNGGGNWSQQMFNPNAYDICFINKDTGWYSTNDPQGKLYRTINGGTNWTLQYTATNLIHYLFFQNGRQGWIQSGSGNSLKYSTDGGFNWSNSQGLDVTGYNTHFINDSIGYSGIYLSNNIAKSTNGGKNWGHQNTPWPTGFLIAPLQKDTANAWAGDLFHTIDGGGPIIYTDIQQIGSNIPDNFKLYQNYPNPFNSMTNVKFKMLKQGFAEIKVFNITGKLITVLIQKNLNSGEYEVHFNAGDLTSGIYFYRLIYTDKKGNIFTDTKKMILIK